MVTGNDKQASWPQLKDMEIKRRKILSRWDLPLWRILVKKSGTCLGALVRDLLIWLTLACYIGIRIQIRQPNFQPFTVDVLGGADINIIGSFLSFFLVLFVNQTNTRFLEMYGFSKACSGRIQDVAGMASTQLPTEETLTLVRHMNAAHVAGYVGVSKTYKKHNFFDHFNKEHNLLTPEEMELINPLYMDSGSATLKELVTWCQRDVGRAKKAGYIDSYEANELHSRIVSFRASMDGIYDYCDQPPHFFYIHFLCLLSIFYLPLFAINNAYAAGLGDDTHISVDLLNGIIVFLQCIFVVGLRLLGQKMIDPYGSDMEDLSVITYVETTLEICNTITSCKHK